MRTRPNDEFEDNAADVGLQGAPKADGERNGFPRAIEKTFCEAKKVLWGFDFPFNEFERVPVGRGVYDGFPPFSAHLSKTASFVIYRWRQGDWSLDREVKNKTENVVREKVDGSNWCGEYSLLIE